MTYVALLLLECMALRSQHRTSYSQFMFNGMLLNPAYAGSHEALNLTALYRHQWTGINGAPRAISFSAHSPFRNRNLNAAIIFESEQAGLFKQTQSLGAFAYRIRLQDAFLSFGLQAGMQTISFDRELLRIRHEDDPAFMQSALRTTAFSAGAGAYLHAERYYIGLSAPELTSLSGSDHRLTQLHGGGLLKPSTDVTLKPSLLLRHLQNSPLFISGALTGYYKEIFGIGAGYAAGAAWFIYLDLRINEQLNFGYAYERSTGAISAYTSGGHEIMLRYLFRYRITAINPRYF